MILKRRQNLKIVTAKNEDPAFKESPNSKDGSSSQSIPSIPDISQYVNDESEQLLKLFCDKSVESENYTTGLYIFQNYLLKN